LITICSPETPGIAGTPVLPKKVGLAAVGTPKPVMALHADTPIGAAMDAARTAKHQARSTWAEETHPSRRISADLLFADEPGSPQAIASLPLTKGHTTSFRSLVQRQKAKLWIAKESHNPVKIATMLPAMGGATMTAELAQ
jgi:hypothetical protein